MEIKSSLLNSKEFGLVKDSLIKVSEIDHKEDFRVNMLEYINDSADNDDDEFFFDMLEFVRFLNPNSDAVAYTTPEHLIYLNAPAGGGYGEKVRIWDFIYDHECLHQLWDTFGVGAKLKADGIEYDHYILNIASDCVINDYLSYYRKKDQPENGITPEYLKKEYGVIYDRKKDTQYTLYLKLLEHKNELKEDERCQDQCGDDQQSGESGDSSDNQNQQGSGSGKGKSSKQDSSKSKGSSSEDKSDEEQAQDAANEAQSAADKAKDAAGDDKDKQGAANKAQEAADKAKEEAEKAKEAAKNGDKDEAKEHTEAAKKAAQEAKDAAKEAGVKDEESGEKGDKGKGGNKGEGNGKGQGHGGSDGESKKEDVDLEKIKKDAEAVINKYKEKLSGDIGTFINQCRASQSLKESGLVTGAQKGVSAWNQKLQQYTSAYVKNKVFKKQREFKRTYQKVKRGSGFVEYGQPIQRGKKLKDDKLLINVAFYVDRSGSMGGCIDEVFKASYVIANSLQKQFGKEKVVDKVSFRMFAFDDKMEEVDWGKKVNSRGGTMGFDEILKFIKEKTNDYMINIIITDAEFDVKENEIEKFLKEVYGCVVFVTNNQSSDVKRIANKQENKTKLFYVQADNDFTIGK